MEYVIYIALILVGACLGSFAGATVWRLRAKQLAADKKQKQAVDAKEYEKLKPLARRKVSKDRSQCLHCGYTLKWYDLIPLVSWLSLRGRCRQCHKRIGLFEPLIELGMIAFFVGSYIFWPFDLTTGLEIARFVIWLVSGVILAMLFAYDAKWYLLPDKLTAALAGLGVATVAIAAIQSGSPAGTITSAVIALAILSGVYLAIYALSRGKWIGLGDVKLGVGLALLLVDWQLAFIALFLANLVGCLIVVPLMAAGKLKRTSRVPFGPLLIVGMILAQFIGPYFLSFYLSGLI